MVTLGIVDWQWSSKTQKYTHCNVTHWDHQFTWTSSSAIQNTKLTWERLVPLADGRGLCSKALYVSEVRLRVEEPLRLGGWGHKHWAGGLLECQVSRLTMSRVRWWSLLPWAHQTHLVKTREVKSLSHYLKRHWRVGTSYIVSTSNVRKIPSTQLNNFMRTSINIAYSMAQFSKSPHSPSSTTFTWGITVLHITWDPWTFPAPAPPAVPLTPVGIFNIKTLMKKGTKL